jgi:SAM-dependent methyltransferase
MEMAKIQDGDRVLDLGAGLAGPARLLASHGCSVDCIELSPDYCAGAALLNRLTGLEDRVRVHEGSALALPFATGTFDAAWMQNVGMNIADKRALYAEVHRVLGTNGRFAFQEILAGEIATSHFPLPWATDPADSFLVTADEMRALLGECGFSAESFDDISAAHLGKRTANAAPTELSLSVFVVDLAEKAANARRSLEEGQIRYVRAVFRAR